MTFQDYKFSPWRVKGDQRIVASESTWKRPLEWDREAAAAGERWRALVAADVFEDWNGRMRDASGLPLERSIIPGNWWNSNGQLYGPDDGKGVTMADVRDRLFRLIDATPNFDWLLLTKRPENVLRMTYAAWCLKVPGHVSQNEGDGRSWAWPKNVWIGTSVENQEQADKRIPELLKTPSAVRFLSMEPLLGAVDLEPYLYATGASTCGPWHYPSGRIVRGAGCGGQMISQRPANELHWVIVGVESGPGARPMHPDWARSIRDQCQAAGVPFFFKGWGDCLPCDVKDVNGVYHAPRTWGSTHAKIGKKAAGRLLDGREWNEIPKVGGGS